MWTPFSLSRVAGHLHGRYSARLVSRQYQQIKEIVNLDDNSNQEIRLLTFAQTMSTQAVLSGHRKFYDLPTTALYDDAAEDCDDGEHCDQQLLQYVYQQVVGCNTLFRGPFGVRRLVSVRVVKTHVYWRLAMVLPRQWYGGVYHCWRTLSVICAAIQVILICHDASQCPECLRIVFIVSDLSRGAVAMCTKTWSQKALVNTAVTFGAVSQLWA